MNTSMREGTPTACEMCEARLLEGQRPAGDAALAAHVGSCLGCFRLASDLRDLPKIRALLDDAPAADPGARFWDSFAARVGDAWEQSRAAARPVEPPAAPSLWRRAIEWLRMPVPAALAGSALTAALVLAVVRTPPIDRAPAVRDPGASASAAATAAGQAAGTKGRAGSVASEGTGGFEEELIGDLDVGDLRALLKDIHDEMGGSAPPISDDEAETTTAAEELEILDDGVLRALTGKLGRNI